MQGLTLQVRKPRPMEVSASSHTTTCDGGRAAKPATSSRSAQVSTGSRPALPDLSTTLNTVGLLIP